MIEVILSCVAVALFAVVFILIGIDVGEIDKK